ncbi:hypothetical protein IGI04_022958 [Brassica rapa subsp. trilocularis]|uniref:Uncharacterized protein n=1 Tax=Brassica rapa subsp. trilocularis TaxID=1813537 RepID=A0ABQ7M526_BRACM|nr:hypothetical protein IGI04_022958 [Brassica rapa subsp. trilocularis]
MCGKDLTLSNSSSKRLTISLACSIAINLDSGEFLVVKQPLPPPLPDFGGHGRDNQPGDDMLGAGAVKTNPTDRFNSASPEKIPDGDNAGML